MVNISFMLIYRIQTAVEWASANSDNARADSNRVAFSAGRWVLPHIKGLCWYSWEKWAIFGCKNPTELLSKRDRNNWFEINLYENQFYQSNFLFLSAETNERTVDFFYFFSKNARLLPVMCGIGVCAPCRSCTSVTRNNLIVSNMHTGSMIPQGLD